jgi:hypothetical protein
MVTKNSKQDERDYKTQIEDNFKDAMKCLNMLRPENIDDKLQHYVGLNLAILELKRIALGEPKIYAPIKP